MGQLPGAGVKMYTPPKELTLEQQIANALNPKSKEPLPNTEPRYPHTTVPNSKCVAPSHVNVSGDGAIDITGNVVTTNKGVTCR